MASLLPTRSMPIEGRDYRTGEPIRLAIDKGRIVEHNLLPAESSAASNLRWIAPGFVDLQSNGYGGQEFSSPTLTVEHVGSITRQHWHFGVTQYLPTVTTNSFEVLQHAMRTITEAIASLPDV